MMRGDEQNINGVPIFNPEDRSASVFSLRANGVTKGKTTGFESLDKIFTIKKGFPLFVAGAPHHGKSQVVKQLLVNLSEIHGWRHCLYAGEDGTVEDVMIELAEIYIKKKVRKDDTFPSAPIMSEYEFGSAIEFISQHFRIVSPDDIDGLGSFDLFQFYEWIEQYETTTGIKFDTVVIDPWNDLEQDLRPFGGREDKYLANALKHVRDQSKKHERVDIIVNHIADTNVYHVTDRGRRYSPPAEPTQWSGGQTWHRRAFTMLLVYRPPAPDSIKFSSRQNPIETKVGECWIINQKSKPKGTGKLGRAVVYFSKGNNAFFEEDDRGNKFWSGELTGRFNHMKNSQSS